MLNWKGIGVNTLWIVGAALCLATFSYCDWWAYNQKIRRRQVWRTTMFVAPFSIGLALVSATFAFKTGSPLVRVFWAAWSTLLIAQSIFWSIKPKRP